MIALGIVPVCGASLPGGPAMSYSRCRAAGLLTSNRLHLDHEPPLRPDERINRHAIEDPRRVGWLCESCHSAKTLSDQQGAPR